MHLSDVGSNAACRSLACVRRLAKRFNFQRMHSYEVKGHRPPNAIKKGKTTLVCTKWTIVAFSTRANKKQIKSVRYPWFSSGGRWQNTCALYRIACRDRKRTWTVTRNGKRPLVFVGPEPNGNCSPDRTGTWPKKKRKGIMRLLVRQMVRQQYIDSVAVLGWVHSYFLQRVPPRKQYEWCACEQEKDVLIIHTTHYCTHSGLTVQ